MKSPSEESELSVQFELASKLESAASEKNGQNLFNTDWKDKLNDDVQVDSDCLTPCIGGPH